MEKNNRFSKHFVKKSDSELQSIITSERHVFEAKQAATWELQRRNLTPGAELPEPKPRLREPKHRMSESKKRDFKRNMIFSGIIIIGIAIYFNYDTVLVQESSLNPIEGSIQYSRTYIERVSSTNRYGYKHESNKATLEIKLYEHPSIFRIFENIEQKRFHNRFKELTSQLARSTPVTIWVPNKPTRFGPDFFKLDVRGETEVDMEDTTWINRFSFMLLLFVGSLIIYLGTRTDWAENVKDFFKN